MIYLKSFFLYTILFSFFISSNALAAPSQQQLEEKKKKRNYSLQPVQDHVCDPSSKKSPQKREIMRHNIILAKRCEKVKRYITPEAQSAYEASALQGDIYSMIRLSGNKNDLCVVMKNCPEGRKEPTEWRKKWP
ncbi:hypothetical protein ACFS4T_16375 [Pseudomonas lini]